MANIIREPLQKLVRAYPAKSLALALSGQANKQVAVYSAMARNSSGGAANVGIFRSYNSYSRKVYQVASAVVTDVTATLDAGTAVAFFTSVNDYVAYGSKEPAGIASVNVSVAAGAGGTFVVQYWNGAWTTLPTFLTEAYTSTGNRLLVFPAPVDWVAGGITGADTSLYYFRVIATVAPASAASMTRVMVGEMLEFQEAVADGGGVQLSALDSHKPLILDQAEGLLPFFSVVDNLNLFVASYNIVG